MPQPTPALKVHGPGMGPLMLPAEGWSPSPGVKQTLSPLTSRMRHRMHEGTQRGSRFPSTGSGPWLCHFLSCVVPSKESGFLGSQFPHL
jgi:hypothetical protein